MLATTWMLGTKAEPGSSTRAVSAVIHWAISPATQTHVLRTLLTRLADLILILICITRLIMLSILSCFCQTFMYLLLRNAYLDLQLILIGLFVGFFESFWSSWYILDGNCLLDQQLKNVFCSPCCHFTLLIDPFTVQQCGG